MKAIRSSALTAAIAIGLALCHPLGAQEEAADALAKGIERLDEGDIGGAVLILDRAVRELEQKGEPREQQARAHLYLGVGYLGLDQWGKATASFREAARLDPSLTLSEKEFAPKVIVAFETATKDLRSAESEVTQAPATEVAEAQVEPAQATKGGSKLPLILLGVGGAAGGALALASGGGSGDTTTEIDIAGRWSIEHRSTGFCTGTIDFHSSGNFLIDYACPDGWEVSGPWSLSGQTLEYTHTLWVRKQDGEPFAESISYRGTVTASSGTFVINKLGTSHTETISR